MACIFAAMKCFSVFAAPFVNGTIDIGGILANSIIGDNAGIIGSIGSAFLEGSISVDLLQLGSAAITMAILFFGILLWTLAYYVTLPEKNRLKKK